MYGDIGAQLCYRRVPLSKHIRRYFGTVGLTVLHGTEGIHLTQEVLRAVQSFDRHGLREMLCWKRRDGMGFTEFNRKQHAILRRILSSMGVAELAAQLFATQHSWVGHLARLNESHIVSKWVCEFSLEEWRLQQAVGQIVGQSGKRTTWRHSKREPVTRWDRCPHLLLATVGVRRHWSPDVFEP